MQVEVWADVICPWCRLGTHRLEAALERFPARDEVQVTHRSFQLDPGAPAGSSEPVRAMLRKKGLEDGQIGLDPADTRDALVCHRYAARVADEGREAAELGATGVPLFVIDRRYGVAGAQPVDTLLAALQRAWDERRVTGRG
jgi:predicted DsbA family dithiol-disulfide isomerase